MIGRLWRQTVKVVVGFAGIREYSGGARIDSHVCIPKCCRKRTYNGYLRATLSSSYPAFRCIRGRSHVYCGVAGKSPKKSQPVRMEIVLCYDEIS
jgi:hypothetical protein